MGAGFGIGSPLASALTFRGISRWWSGSPGWRDDLQEALAVARDADPASLALVAGWSYPVAIVYGVLRADDTALRLIEETEDTCQMATNDYALRGAQFALGAALLHRGSVADRERGQELMVRARDEFLPIRAPSLVPVAQVWIARESARRGDHDAAIPVMRSAVHELRMKARYGWGTAGTAVFVETLLERGTDADVAEAQHEMQQLTNAGSVNSAAIVEVTLLRLRALLARSRGDAAAYRDLTDRYRVMAESLGYEGHMAWAAEMAEAAI